MQQACDDLLLELNRVKSSANAIQFEGLNVFGASDLLKTLRERGVVTDGLPLRTEQIEQAQTELKKVMAAQGYIHASIVARDEQSDPNLRKLTFVVNVGEPVLVAEIRFVGNRIFSTSELSAQVWKCWNGDNPEGNTSQVYDAEEFDVCLRQLNNFVRSKGYLQARFHDPENEESKAGLVITVHADEDKLYRLGEITIEGARAVPTDRVRQMLSLRPGDAANGELIGEWLFEDLKKTYGEQGYIQYTAEPTPEFKSAANGTNEGIVDFKVTIEEGQQFRVGAIKFQGSNLADKELRAHLRLRPGDVFNERLFEESINELNKLGRFENVDRDRDVDFQVDQESGLIDLVIKIKTNEPGPRWK
jgi:outer membrane protein insertion porin family